MILGVIGVALAAAIATYLVLRVIRPAKHRVAAPPTTVADTTTTTTTTLPKGAPITAAQLKALTASLVPFVEHTRQLSFTSAPKPVLEDSAAYDRAFTAYLAHSDGLADRLSTPFKVLGMNPNEADLDRAMTAFYGTRTVAFYDTTTNTLHVRATPATPYLSAMLVVSLTEQLDDQHFTTDRIADPPAFGDGVIGLRTLVEGDGWRVANAWVNSRPPKEQSQAQAELKARRGGDADTKRVPAALADWLRLPANVGPSFTSNLVTATSSAPLNAAFKAPPDGSAQVTSPGRFQAPVAQLAVAVPDVDGKVDASGTFGQFMLNEFLDGVASDRVLSLAMNGYRGDTLVAYEKGSRSCVRLDVSTGDSSPTNMRAALGAWATQRDGKVTLVPDAAHKGRKLVRLDVCTPGSDDSGSTTTTTTGPSGSNSSSTIPGRPLA